MTKMAEIKTIKDIDEETWAEFKSLAAKNKVKLGIFFKSLVKDHKKSSTDFWNTILKGEKILSEEESKSIKEITEGVRKEYGFRI
jgi:methionyl-tRNA synthetase